MTVWQKKRGYGIISPVVNKYLGPLKSYQLALQISSVLLCVIFGSLFGGIWLDRKMGTTPCLMLLLMVLGLIIAIYTTYRIAQDQ